jgi:hypothetical protein
LLSGDRAERLPFLGTMTMDYWDEAWRDRTELLNRVIGYLTDRRWTLKVDSGWSHWDLDIYRDTWTCLKVQTVQEDHGSGKRLLRLRYRLRPGLGVKVLGAAGLVFMGVGFHFHALSAGVAAGMLILSGIGIWMRGLRLGSQALAAVNTVAREMNMIRCSPASSTDLGNAIHPAA